MRRVAWWGPGGGGLRPAVLAGWKACVAWWAVPGGLGLPFESRGCEGMTQLCSRPISVLRLLGCVSFQS
jgi:hypothetical protein